MGLPERYVHPSDSIGQVSESSFDRNIHEFNTESIHRRPRADIFTLFRTHSPSVHFSNARLTKTKSGILIRLPTRSPSISFDDFLVAGRSLGDLTWNIDEARSLGVLDIRNWRAGSAPYASIKELDSKVVERRTNLWKIVLSQESLPPDTLDTSPFRIPLDPGSRRSLQQGGCSLPSLPCPAHEPGLGLGFRGGCRDRA